jgi:hypothetical protein
MINKNKQVSKDRDSNSHKQIKNNVVPICKNNKNVVPTIVTQGIEKNYSKQFLKENKLILSYNYSKYLVEIFQDKKLKTILWVYENKELIGLTSPNDIMVMIQNRDRIRAEDTKNALTSPNNLKNKDLVFKQQNTLNNRITNITE